VCEDSQGQIYIHHTVHSTRQKHDSMVVFDESGKFVKSWGRDFEGGAHGLHIRKEGNTEFLYLCEYAPCIGGEDDDEWRGRVHARHAH